MSETSSASTKTNQTSLKSFCHYFDNSKESDDADAEVNKFVGLKYINNKLEIHFPVGYAHSDQDDEKQIRKEILNLISVLSSFGYKDSMLSSANIFAKSTDVHFPIHAYLYIITDFMNHGYYNQKEVLYKKETSGKINWSRTIKQVRPQIINQTIFYTNFVTRHTNYTENELISQIHKYCVWECFSKIGYLFCSYVPEKSQLKLNKKLFIAVIQSKAATTFNETELLLFKNMLDIIKYLDSSNENANFVYGTQNFHHIWEALVDSVYGEKDKDKFYPKVYWKLKNSANDSLKTYSFSDAKRNSLRPDTIMITNRGTQKQKIFVLDSKYYRYGYTQNPSHLPDSSSVVKQLAYAQYIDSKQNCLPSDVKKNINSTNIYNAFIMPSQNAEPQNIGYTSADYVLSTNEDNAEKPYYKIHGILLDIKSLMFSHIPHDKDAIAVLVKAIES